MAALVMSAWLGLALQGGPSIAGRVIDAQTGGPVAGAAIVIDGRIGGATGADGVFSVPALRLRSGQAGSTRRVDVLVTAVGYAFVTRRVDVTAAGGADLGDVRLNRESAAFAERVEVRGGEFPDTTPARTLTKADLQMLSMVFVDDPIRSAPSTRWQASPPTTISKPSSRCEAPRSTRLAYMSTASAPADSCTCCRIRGRRISCHCRW